MKADHPWCTPGLVVALKKEGDVAQQWHELAISVQTWLDNNMNGQFLNVQTGQGAQDPLNNIQGYNNTKALEEYNRAHQNALINIVELAITYRTTVSAPKSSSDWYIPSAKELSLLCGAEVSDIVNEKSGGTANRELINTQLLLVKGTELTFDQQVPYLYWSSSEYYSDRVFVVNFFDGTVSTAEKILENYRYTRFTLAF